jgi:GxxExxY protein
MGGDEINFDEMSSEVIGAAIEVHKYLGAGFLESVYHNALKKELEMRKLDYETEKLIQTFYKGDLVGEHRLDLVINNQVVVELKTVKEIVDAHKAQVISYLKASGIKVGLLLNFSKSKLDIKRIVWKY